MGRAAVTDHDHANGSTATSSRVTLFAGAVCLLLIMWFLFAWLVLDRHVLDAAGESVGTAFAIGIVVSLIGALRTSR
jgi:hypothetical protein